MAPELTPFTEITFGASAVTTSSPQAHPPIQAEIGRYRLRLAQSCEDRDAACRLRFKVFNIELGEGLESSYETGLDFDRFDPYCEHLIVEEPASRRIVGTYRMQSGSSAGAQSGLLLRAGICSCALRTAASRHSGTGARGRGSRAPHAGGAHTFVAWDCAVCHRDGTSLPARLLFAELQKSARGLADVSPVGVVSGFAGIRDDSDPAVCLSRGAAETDSRNRMHSRSPVARIQRVNSDESSQTTQSVPDAGRAHCRAAGLGSLVRDHRFSDVARSGDRWLRQRGSDSWGLLAS